jgi:hypothetical protein
LLQEVEGIIEHDALPGMQWKVQAFSWGINRVRWRLLFNMV